MYKIDHSSREDVSLSFVVIQNAYNCNKIGPNDMKYVCFEKRTPFPETGLSLSTSLVSLKILHTHNSHCSHKTPVFPMNRQVNMCIMPWGWEYYHLQFIIKYVYTRSQWVSAMTAYVWPSQECHQPSYRAWTPVNCLHTIKDACRRPSAHTGLVCACLCGSATRPGTYSAALLGIGLSLWWLQMINAADNNYAEFSLAESYILLNIWICIYARVHE